MHSQHNSTLIGNDNDNLILEDFFQAIWSIVNSQILEDHIKRNSKNSNPLNLWKTFQLLNPLKFFKPL